jgi:hypothetical protein
MKKILYSLMFSAILIGANAQTDLTNTGLMYITNAADTVFISGSLQNNAGANLNNAGGNLFVKQDVTNNEVNMTVGGGKLWTTGNVVQTFYGATPFKTHNWIVNNSNNVALQNRVEVGNGTGGSLTFINGKITSGTNTQDVCFNTGSSYTGYSTTNHIIGFCTKRGASNFTFPIGDGTYQADLDIDNLSSSNEFQCKYFGNIYSSLATTLPLISVFDKEYWILDRITGASGANITLKWNDARKALNHSIPSGLRVGHFTGTSWISEGGTGSGNTPTGSVTSVMVNSFSPFTFASEGSILPITFNSFTVTANANCNAAIKWQATSESNVKQYYVQKWLNNVWVSIQTILPTISNSASNYMYIDDKAIAGVNKYRVATELKSGVVNYTETKQIVINCTKSFSKVYPTIASQLVNVETPNDYKKITLKVINASGQIVYQKDNINAGKLTIPIANLAAGSYKVIVASENRSEIFAVIKQ